MLVGVVEDPGYFMLRASKMSCLQGFGAGESVTFHSSGLTVKVLGMLDHQLFRPPKLPVHTDILKIGTAYCSVIDDVN